MKIKFIIALLLVASSCVGQTTVTFHSAVTGYAASDELGLPREQVITLSDGSVVLWRTGSPELIRTYDSGATWTETLNIGFTGTNHAHLSSRNDTIFIADRTLTDGTYLTVVDATGVMSLIIDHVAQYPGVTCSYASTTGSCWPLPGSSRFEILYRGGDCSFISVDHASVASYTDTATAVIFDASAVGAANTRIGGGVYGGDLYAWCFLTDTALYVYKYDSSGNSWSADGNNAMGTNDITGVDNVSLDDITLGTDANITSWLGNGITTELWNGDTENRLALNFSIVVDTAELHDSLDVIRGEISDSVAAIPQFIPFAIETPVANDTLELPGLPIAYTIDSVIATVRGGTNVVFQLEECGDNGGAGTDVGSSDFTAPSSARTAWGASDFSNAGIDRADILRYVCTSQSGDPSQISIIIFYH